jgi:hypothetical protein
MNILINYKLCLPPINFLGHNLTTSDCCHVLNSSVININNLLALQVCEDFHIFEKIAFNLMVIFEHRK